jgi:uncharacterized protein YndB with AHSA1/START domain
MTTFEYTYTFDYPAAVVFALLTDLAARPTWIAGILEVRVTSPGPARLGTSYFEAGKFSGFKSEKTLFVTEFEQDRLLTLATPAEAKDPWRESYLIEPLSGVACRVHFSIEVAEFFMRQQMKKDQPQHAARLKSLIASRA